MATIAKLVVDLEMNDSGFSSTINNSNKSLEKWGKRLMATGAVITGAFAAPIIAGSKAAWNQVDAVEQATVALRAYESDTEAVNKVLADLIAYAQSDLGVLFQRQDLFAAAQGLKIMGAETENLVEYVEIMSRSVGLGVGNWDELSRVIGRVGATGRMTGDDFDMLTKMGYQLDDSLRNTNMTWEELFEHLDKGIPADALAGQADTIRGKSIRLQSALRGLGLSFLGVDRETSKFIEGGLGWQMMRGMERLRSLFIAAAPAVGRFGDMLAAIGRPLGQVFDWLLRLPQSVQTAMLMFTAGTGVLMTFSGGLLLMLPRIANTVAAFRALGPAITAARVAMTGLFMNPAMLAAIAVIGAAILAYKTNFLGFGDTVDSVVDRLQRFFGLPDSKDISVTTSFDGNQHFIEQVTLPDGTKEWIIREKDGQEFGKVISSYTDPDDPNYAYITIEPTDGGESFQTRVNLLTSELDDVEIDVTLNTAPAISEWEALKWKFENDGFFGTLNEGFLTMLQGMSDAFGGWLNDQGAKWGERFSDMFSSVSELASDTAGALTMAGYDLVTGFHEGALNAWDTVTGWLGTLPALAFDAVGVLTGTLMPRGAEIIDGFYTAVTTRWVDVRTWFVNLSAMIFNAVGSLSSTLTQRGTEIMNGFYTAVTNRWVAIRTWFINMPTMAFNAVGSMSRTLWDRGTQALTGFYSAVVDKWTVGGVRGWFTGLGSRIIGAVGDLGSSLWGAGQAVLQGFWDGMASKWNEITGWLSSLNPADWKGPYERDLKMLYENGVGTMLGYSRGLEQGWQNVVKQLSGYSPMIEVGVQGVPPKIRGTAGSMLNTVVPQSALNTPIGHGGYGGGTTVIDNSTHTETYVALNDRQFAELLAAKDKANIVHDAMTNRHSASQYGGGRR